MKSFCHGMKSMTDKYKEIFDEKKFQKEIEKAKGIYFSWPEKIYCPALAADVKITRYAWEHIVKNEDRTKNQIYFRAKNFIQGRKLIETINKYQNHTIKSHDSGENHFWLLQGVVDKCLIKVVIRQSGNQPKQFFSLVYLGGRPKKV
jgi:hypothetical protein